VTLFFRYLALSSYFGLLLSLLAWIILGEHADNFPTYALIIIASLPLLFPLRGLLHGKIYTHAWYSFLLLLYFLHGIGELYSSDSFNLYAFLEILFSTVSFISSITYIKLNAKMGAESQK
jgi:uncharacterized membrane protein